MTVSEGYPDYQRVQTRALAPLVNDVFDTGGLVTDMGPYYVSNYPELLFKFIGDSVADYSIAFQWYADAALTQGIYVKSMRVTGNVPVLATPVKVAGPWLNVQVIPNNWVTGHNIQFILVPSYNPMSVREINDPLLIAQSAHSTAASTTDTVYFSAVMEGPVSWWWNSAATSWAMTLDMMDSSFAWQARYTINSTSSSALGFATIALPPYPMRVRFMNNDATAKLWSATIGSLMY